LISSATPELLEDVPIPSHNTLQEYTSRSPQEWLDGKKSLQCVKTGRKYPLLAAVEKLTAPKKQNGKAVSNEQSMDSDSENDDE
jgi:hypothetical protein